MNDKEFAILKIYHELKEIPWHELRDNHTVGINFMDWAVNKNAVQTVVADINQKLEDYKFIERIPRTIKIDQTSKITSAGENAYYSEQQKRSKYPLNEIEIRSVNYIISSVRNRAWDAELIIFQLIEDYFYQEKIKDNALQVSTIENVIDYLYNNSFIERKDGCTDISQFINNKGHDLVKCKTIEKYWKNTDNTEAPLLTNFIKEDIEESLQKRELETKTVNYIFNAPLTGSQFNHGEKIDAKQENKPREKKSFLKKTITIFPIIAAILAICTYFGLNFNTRNGKATNNEQSSMDSTNNSSLAKNDAGSKKNDPAINKEQPGKNSTNNSNLAKNDVSSKKNDPVIPENIVETKSMNEGHSENFFNGELLVSLIAIAYEGDPLRHTVIANISCPGMKVINIDHKDIGYALPYKGKHNYIITILAANTFEATFQVTKSK